MKTTKALLVLTVLYGWHCVVAGDSPHVQLVLAPEEGLQPQAAVDTKGTLHLIYFKGNAAAGDLFYVRRGPKDKAFSKPIRVNHRRESVVAKGTVRGAHLALGKEGRPHVVWMGSRKTVPLRKRHGSPLFYTRLAKDGKNFEVERNVIRFAYGLDGGGSVAADEQGNVHVLWHAPALKKEGEANRQIWAASSSDEGKTFLPETVISESTGVCGCCGMRAFASHRGGVYVLYRSATKTINRDVYLLSKLKAKKKFRSQKVDPWPVAACPMSTMSFSQNKEAVFAAWETRGQVYFAKIAPKTGTLDKKIKAPGKGGNRKHPAIAVDEKGNVLLAWTEGTGWNRGGKLAWQVFNSLGSPTKSKGRKKGVRAWSLLSAVTLPDGRFVIVY